MQDILDQCYEIIRAHYGGRIAARSQVLLINHIDDGLFILERIGASKLAQAAFCLHPIFQENKDLKSIYENFDLTRISPYVILLVMEYRYIANSYLSGLYSSEEDEFDLSPLDEVNQMLIADKIQNRMDFEIYHKDTHSRSEELEKYFKNWLRKLGISEEEYQNHIQAIEEKLIYGK